MIKYNTNFVLIYSQRTSANSTKIQCYVCQITCPGHLKCCVEKTDLYLTMGILGSKLIKLSKDS